MKEDIYIMVYTRTKYMTNIYSTDEDFYRKRCIFSGKMQLIHNTILKQEEPCT